MIVFTNADIKFNLKNRLKIKEWVKSIIASENGKSGDITYVFCSDDYVFEMNNQYLQHNTLTDIITFDYSENGKISGDICISIDRVKENAESYRIDFDRELARVMAHGVLHLLGYKDKKAEEKKVMTSKEDFYLQLWPTV